MHPTARILLYLLSALALPGLSLFSLAILFLCLLVVAHQQVGAWLALLFRAKWLFLLLLLTHAYQLPGEPFLATLGDASPTREGLEAGLLQAFRLGLMLMLLHAWVLAMPRDRLVAGLHGLLAPFRTLGADPDRITVRLSLTLTAMERRMGPHVLHDLLQGRLPGHDLPAHQPLAVVAWGWVDGLGLALGTLVLAGLWVNV